MLYRLVKVMMGAALRIFYRQILTRNLDRIPASGPVVLVANHPSSLMDAAIIGILLKRPIHFFARGDIFINPLVNRMLRAIHMHPVHHHAAGRHTLSANDNAFQTATQLLAAGEVVVFFPEGTSHTDYHLLPFRKGAFRLALNTLDKFPALQLPIVPIGINYSHPTRLFSRVWVQAGHPVSANQFLPAFQLRPAHAIRLLTNTAWLEVKSLVVETTSHHSPVLSQVLEVVRNDYPWSREVSPDAIDRELAVAASATQWEPAFKQEIDDYEEALKKFQIRDAHVAGACEAPLSVVPLYMGLPAAFIGWLLNGLPLMIARMITDSKVKRVDFYSWILVSSAALLYIAWFCLMVTLSLLFLPFWKMTAFLFIIVATGQYSWNYLAYFRQWQLQRQAAKLPAAELQKLVQKRKAIISRF